MNSDSFRDDDSLIATIDANLGVGADFGLESSVRFERAVALIAKRRFLHHKETAARRPIIFVQDLVIPESLDGAAMIHAPMIDSGNTAIGEHVWFMNSAGTEARGHRLPPEYDDMAVFNTVRLDVRLSARPAAVVESRDGMLRMRVYRRGLGDVDNVATVDLFQRNLSSDEIKRALDDIWNASLKAPGAFSSGKVGPWKDASKHWAHEDAELRIQSIVEAGLKQRFMGYEIRHEQTQISGRLDLEIEEPHYEDRSVVTRHAILELKVLREFGHTGRHYEDAKNDDSLREGVRQALIYREDRGSRISALCCYDMRKAFLGDSAFSPVKDIADDGSVLLWHWHRFASPAAYRQHEFSQDRA